MAHNRSTGAAFSWSEFASEGDSDPITGSSSPDVSPSPIPPRLSRRTTALPGANDALGGLSAFPSEAVDDAAVEPQADPNVHEATLVSTQTVASHSLTSRSLRAVAAAFLFGAASTLVTLAVVDNRPKASPVHARIDSLAVSDGIPVRVLADLERVDVRPPIPVARPKRVAPQRVIASQADDVRPDETVTAYSEPAVSTRVSASYLQKPASDEETVRQKLRSYEFYQGAGFRACNVVVSGEQATAECRGSMTQTPSPDSPSPSSEHQWTFKMRRDGATWKIDEVSRSSPMDAPR